MTTSLRGTGSVLVTVETLERPVHSGMYGGAAPDALAALIVMLATLRDGDGETTIRGLDAAARWTGADYPAERFRADAGVLDGVSMLGGRDGRRRRVGAARRSTCWPSTRPPVAGATAAIQHTARALVNLRVPPGQDAAAAQALLVDHLHAVAPWGAQVTVERRRSASRSPRARTAPASLRSPTRWREAFGRPLTTAGQGGAIPLCNALQSGAPGRRDPADRRGGAGQPDPRAERERGPRELGAPRWPKPCYCERWELDGASPRSGPSAYRQALARIGCPLGYSKSCSPSNTNRSRSQRALDGPLVTLGKA